MCDFQYYFLVPSSRNEENANENDSEPVKKKIRNSILCYKEQK
jgi:hypothetical protein